MIPPDEKEEKTLVETFVDGLPGSQVYEKNSKFRQLLDLFFQNELHSMESWDDWHDFLAANGIVLAKGRAQKWQDEKWFYWASQKKFQVLRSPTSVDRPGEAGDRYTEYLLVPQKTIEKLILLGCL
jgi:hypothetical protein